MHKVLRFLQLFSPMAFGVRMIEAAEAFETPPRNLVARRQAWTAACSLLIGASLLLMAALMDTLANARPLSEKIGFSGLLCLIVTVHSGLCYKDSNNPQP